MAIKRGLRNMLAEVGKIKIGGKSDKEYTSKAGNKYRAPVKYDRFVITTTERDANKNLIVNKELTESLKDPRELKIRLPFDSVDKNFFTQYQMYASKKCLCRGDGETAVRIATKNGKFVFPFEDGDKEIEVKDGQEVEIKCDPDKCPFYQPDSKGNQLCKVSGILSCFLPESKDLGGVYKFRTHSYNSVSSILAALKYFRLNTGGILQGLPLKMVMVKKTTEQFGNIDYVTIVIDGEEILGLRRLALEEMQSRKMLGTNIEDIEKQAEISGFFKDTDPEDITEAEFYHQEESEQPGKGYDSEDVKKELEKQVEKEQVAPPALTIPF